MHLNPVLGPVNSIYPKYLILPNCISSPFRIARSSLTPSMASAQASPTCTNTADNVATFFLPPPHWNQTHNSPLMSFLHPQTRPDSPSNFREGSNSSIPSVVVEETTQYPSFAKRLIYACRSSNHLRSFTGMSSSSNILFNSW